VTLSKLQILAHRGLWLESGLEKNSLAALLLAFEQGFGVEFDIRDYQGEIVISHDSPTEYGVRLENLLDLAGHFPEAPLAINIKSDGLAAQLASYSIPNPHFYFDMSVPQEREYISHSLPVASRISEYEVVERNLHEKLWVDAFESDWYINHSEYMGVITAAAGAVFVSPELHGREHKESWGVLGPLLSAKSALGICTDFPNDFWSDWSTG